MQHTHSRLWLSGLAALVLALVLTPTAWAAQLQVTVTNIQHSDGVVRVAVCDRDHFTDEKCQYVAQAVPEDGRAKITFDDIPPGIYAVQAYDDANGNDELDTNWIGWPKEGMGFSNDAPMHHGPPSYNDAAIKLVEPAGAIRFKMRYY